MNRRPRAPDPLRVIVRDAREPVGGCERGVEVVVVQEGGRRDAHRRPVAEASVWLGVVGPHPVDKPAAVGRRVAATPLLERLRGPAIVQQDICNRGRADGVVREVALRMEEVKRLGLDPVPLVDRSDNVADNRAPHVHPPCPLCTSTPDLDAAVGASPCTSQPALPTRYHAFRHRNRASSRNEADRRDRGHRRAGSRRNPPVRALQGQSTPRRGAGPARPRREARPGDGLQPHGGGRGEVDDLGRPGRRPESARAQSGPLHPRGFAGAGVRNQGRRGRRRLLAGRADGGHQPPLHG